MAACPFYLGSLTATATSDLTVTMECEDETQAEVTLENLTFDLAQPAFGIAALGSASKGFPAGALLFESYFEVDAASYGAVMPNTLAVEALVEDEAFAASDLEVNLTVPCNSSTAQVRLTIDLASPVTGGSLEQPPAVAITVAANPVCGRSLNLTATSSDGDSDLVGVRWRIDGVLMSTTMTSFTPTGTHTLEAIARDARGAVTTDRLEVTCN